MRSKTFIAAVLVIAGCWLALQLIRTHFRHRIIMNRHRQISVARTEIGKIKDSLDLAAEGSASAKDLLSIVEINRFEGQIRDLRMENAIDQSESNDNAFPDILPLIFLVVISQQVGMLDKKIRPGSELSE